MVGDECLEAPSSPCH